MRKIQKDQRLRWIWSDKSFTPGTVDKIYSKFVMETNGDGKQRTYKQFVVVVWDDGKQTNTSVDYLLAHTRFTR